MKIKVRNGGLQTAPSRVDVAGLRNFAQANPKEFASRIHDIVRDPKEPLTWLNVGDIRALQDALSDVQVEMYEPKGARSIMTSAFPVLVSGLTIGQLTERFEQVETIGQDITTDMDDQKKVTVVPGILSFDNAVARREEMESYPLIGAGEEKYQGLNCPNGRRVAISQELFDEADTLNIAERINQLAEICLELMETQTIRRVFDIDGSGTAPAEPYVLRYNGTGTALYQTSNTTLTRLHASGNRITNNALVSDVSLETARVRLAGNKNERGMPVALPRSDLQLVVPDALLDATLKILNSEMIPGVLNEYNPWGPKGRFAPRVISSPYIDQITTTTWLFGAVQRQFYRKWKLRPEAVVMSGVDPSNTSDYLKSRIGYQARVAWDMEVFARGYHLVEQCLSGTTAP